GPWPTVSGSDSISSLSKPMILFSPGADWDAFRPRLRTPSDHDSSPAARDSTSAWQGSQSSMWASIDFWSSLGSNPAKSRRRTSRSGQGDAFRIEISLRGGQDSNLVLLVDI